MALNSTAGSASADSFCSVDFADNYLFTERLGADSWDDASTPEKEAVLRQATRTINKMRMKGWKATSTQALNFPATGIFDQHGIEYDDETVPTDLQRATAELAFTLYDNSAVASGESLSEFGSIKIGQIQFSMNQSASADDGIPKVVEDLLSDFVYKAQARSYR